MTARPLRRRYGHSRTVRKVTRVTRTGHYGPQGETRRAKMYMRLECGHMAERRERRLWETDPKTAVCPTCSSE